MAAKYLFQRRLGTVVVVAGLFCGAARAASAQTSDYDETYLKFLTSARKTTKDGSLWMADLSADRNAHRVNDLVTVRVLESLSATGSADSNVNKNSNSAVVFPTPAAKALAKV